MNSTVHGSVHVWGYSKACGFRTDVLSPVCVFSSNEPNTIMDLAGGDSHSMMRTTSGIVYSWGNNFEVRKACRTKHNHYCIALHCIALYRYMYGLVWCGMAWHGIALHCIVLYWSIIQYMYM